MTTLYSQASMCIQEAIYRHLNLHQCWPARVYISATAELGLKDGWNGVTWSPGVTEFMGVPFTVVPHRHFSGLGEAAPAGVRLVARGIWAATFLAPHP